MLSFKCAFNGIWHCIKNERNFRIHIVAALTIILISPYYQFTKAEMVKLILVIFMVLITEMINTSMEELVNLITGTYHKNAKIIKDVAAGAVAMSALCAVIVAGFMLCDLNVILSIFDDIFTSPYKGIIFMFYIIAATIFIFIQQKGKNNNV